MIGEDGRRQPPGSSSGGRSARRKRDTPSAWPARRASKRVTTGLGKYYDPEGDLTGSSRSVAKEVAGQFPEVPHNAELFDAPARQADHAPEKFQIILVLNEYGDFLSDMACGLAGSLGIGRCCRRTSLSMPRPSSASPSTTPPTAPRPTSPARAWPTRRRSSSPSRCSSITSFLGERSAAARRSRTRRARPPPARACGPATSAAMESTESFTAAVRRRGRGGGPRAGRRHRTMGRGRIQRTKCGIRKAQESGTADGPAQPRTLHRLIALGLGSAGRGAERTRAYAFRSPRCGPVRLGARSVPGPGAERTRAPAPNEPNRPRRANPGLPTERTQDSAPSEPERAGFVRLGAAPCSTGTDPGRSPRQTKPIPRAKRSQSPAPNEANPPRQTKPILGAKRSQSSAPSGPEVRRRANPSVQVSSAAIRLRAGRGRGIPDTGPPATGLSKTIPHYRESGPRSSPNPRPGGRPPAPVGPGSRCWAWNGRGRPGTYRFRIREGHPSLSALCPLGLAPLDPRPGPISNIGGLKANGRVIAESPTRPGERGTQHHRGESRQGLARRGTFGSEPDS